MALQRQLTFHTHANDEAGAMGILIQVIFREGSPKTKPATRASYSRSGVVARERGLKLWREREDLVMAVAYRGRPAEVKPAEREREVWTLRPAR